MKPGPKDKKYYIKIEGDELDELQSLTYHMAESFGLDRQIENYEGKRPIGLYRWDIECLYEVLDIALFTEDEYPDKSSSEYKAIFNLYGRIKMLYDEAFDE